MANACFQSVTYKYSRVMDLNDFRWPSTESDMTEKMEIEESPPEQNIPALTPIQIQQEYFEKLLDYNSSDGDNYNCDYWVKYTKENHSLLVQNIAYALFGTPTFEGELSNFGCIQHVSLQGYTSRQREQVMKIYDKLCEQGKYSLNDEDIVMSVLLIVCAKPRPLRFYQLEPKDYWWDLHNKSDTSIWCTALFRVRKCIPSFDGAQSCRVYIDEDARVYHSWKSYLANNTQPQCVIIAPEDGEYKAELIEAEKRLAVKLSVVPSPALGPTARILSVADTTSTVASIGAIGVLGAAVFTPVGPVIIAGATVATVATGLYGLVRSSLHLHDRNTHEQSISPTDAEARGSWFNIAASSVGIAAGAATTLLSKSAAAGTNMTKTGKILETSVDVLRHANLVTGGAGLANSLAGIAIKYHKHGEPPSKLELFQFTASTLFFANAVMSNRTAQSIVEEAQTKAINNYRDTLRSNRHRKMFDKVSAESRRIEGAIAGNTEVIRGIKNIVNKDQYFADILKINKEVNAHKLRISLTSDGKVNLNAQHKFNPSDLTGMGKESRMELFTKLGPAGLNSPNVSTRLGPPATLAKYVGAEEERSPVKNNLIGINPGEILRVGSLLLKVTTTGAENVADLLHNLTQDLHSALMTVCLNVLATMVPEEIQKMRILSPDKDVIVQVVEFVFNYMKHQRPMGDPCRETDSGVVVILKEFFQDGHVKRETILELKRRYVDGIEEELRNRRSQCPNKREIHCEFCNGIRYA